MSPPPTRPPSPPSPPLDLPVPLGGVVKALEQQFALPASVGTALALEVVAGVVGPAAVLAEAPARPLAPGLHAFLATPAGSTLPLARDALLSPLRAIQGELLALAATVPSRLVEAGDAPAVTEERARLAPVVLAEELPFADFMAAPARAFDRHVFNFYSAAAWERLWTDLVATPNGSRQRLFLQRLAGSGPSSQGGVSVLAELRPGSLAWAGLVDLLPADVHERSLLLDAGLLAGSPEGDAVLPPAMADVWAERVRQLFQLREADTPLEVTLSPPARAAFRRFHAELVKEASLLPAASQELVFCWPVLARKVALLLHLVGGHTEPLAETTAATAIVLARYYGEHLLGLREAARLQLEAQALQADCKRLLTALQQFGTATRRQLFRSFHGQAYERWDRALTALLDDGRVIQLSPNEFAVPESQLPAYTLTV